MTETPTIKKQARPKTPLRILVCRNCGDGYESSAPNSKFCSLICKNERRVAEGKSVAGGGKPAMVAKNEARLIATAKAVANGVSIKEAEANLPVELQWSSQYRNPHLKIGDMTPEILNRFLSNLSETGNAAAAAAVATGKPGSAQFFRDLCKADPDFLKLFNEALDIYGATGPIATAHKVAVEGTLEPIVSMGQVIAHKRVFDTKILAMLLKRYDKEVAAANAGGNGVNVNLTVNSGMQRVDENSEAHAIIFLSETWRLSESDRSTLARIYGQILQIRENQSAPKQIDWEPPAGVKEILDLKVVEVSNDEI